MNHIGTKELQTERLLLRRLTMADAEDMFQNWASDEKVTTYLTWPAHPTVEVTKEVMLNWVTDYEKASFYHWGIVLKETGESIGTIGAVDQEEKIEMVHIGYCIGRKWWGKGYMPEALSETIRFFFEEAGANRVESRFDPRNPNSGKAMAKAGMEYEGTLKQADRNNQGICDAVYYGLTADAYKS